MVLILIFIVAVIIVVTRGRTYYCLAPPATSGTPTMPFSEPHFTRGVCITAILIIEMSIVISILILIIILIPVPSSSSNK